MYITILIDQYTISERERENEHVNKKEKERKMALGVMDLSDKF